MAKEHKMESIGQIIKRVIARQGMEKGIKEGEVLAEWPDIVGEAVAKHAVAVAIEARILFIKVDDSTWRNELSLMSEEIKDRINSRFDEIRVDRIHLI
jgi:predicted nucleic acid-binding Zn ribbon protein